MAYKVDRFNGTFLVNVQDGTIDTTTDIRFVGKNYAGYGEVQNENFLHLMENFAGTIPPPNAVTGQVWYDSANKKLKFWDGNKFKIANGAEPAPESDTPSGLAVGEFWWDTTAQQLYTWSGTDFILVGPEIGSELDITGVQTLEVKDDVNNDHEIVQIVADGKIMCIISRTAFTLNAIINPIEGFTAIKKGITLVNTNALGESSDDHFFWGTASNASRLGQRPASDYLLKDENVVDLAVNFEDPGFELGDDNDLRIWVENGDELIVENQLGNPITFRITTPNIDERDVGVFTSTGLLPGLDSAYDLGTSLVKWRDVHADTVNGNLIGDVTGNSTGVHKGNVLADDNTVLVNATTEQFFGTLNGNCQGTATNANTLQEIAPSIFLPESSNKQSVPIRDILGDITVRRVNGTALQADQLLVGSTHRSASLDSTGNTIAARDNNGDIFARLFQGTATVAQLANIATRLQTARRIRLINGVTGEATFDGSGNIDINCTVPSGPNNTLPTNLGISAGTTVGPVITSSTGTGATLPTASATASGVVTTGSQTWAGVKTFNNTINGNITGNAGTAAFAQSAGNAATATRLQTARRIRLINGVTGEATFDGSGNIDISCTVVGGGGGVTSFSAGTTGLTPLTATSGVVTLAGTLGVSNGGTGVTTSTGTGSTVLSASPVLTGFPIAPTADVTSNSTQIATTAFVKTAAVTLAGSQTITGAKTVTGAFGITNPNPNPTIWPAYSKSKLNANPAFVFDGGSGNQPICTGFLGGPLSGVGTTVLFTFFAYGTTSNNVGSIGCEDGVNTAFTTTSDYRLKENIQPMAGALTKVAQLKPVTYTWKTTGQVDEGFIAHELKEVIPSAVLGTKDELHPDGSPKYQSIDTSFLVATLTAAIQELNAKVDSLQAELTILKEN